MSKTTTNYKRYTRREIKSPSLHHFSFPVPFQSHLLSLLPIPTPPPHLHKGRLNVVDVEEEGSLVDRELGILWEVGNHALGLVVSQGNQRMEVDIACRGNG